MVSRLYLSRMKILLLLFSLCSSISGVAQRWELAREEDGIAVYLCKIPGSGFDAVRAEMMMNVHADSLVAAFRNIEQHRNIFPNSEVIQVLDRPTDSTQVQYTHTNVPWPASDRDGIYHMTFSKDALTGNHVIEAHALPNYIDEKDDIVRIPYSRSRWDVIYINDSTAKVSYFVHVDPGGIVPEWLVNTTIVSMPIQTFRDLRAAFE